jgi:PAS domain-containing protein
MAWQPSPYSYLLVLVAVVAVVVAFYGWRRRGTPGAVALVALMASVFVWSIEYAFEIAVVGLPAKTFWARVEYFGIASVPLAWLAFSLQYTRREGWLKGRKIALLAALPLLTLLLIWTNEAHGLIWSATRVAESGSPVLAVDYGAGFWVHWTYAYLLLLIGTVLLISRLTRSMSIYRKQSVALLLAALAPWVGNGTYVLGLSPVVNLDLTPFAFLFTGIAIALGLFRFRLLDLVPVARDNVIEGMRDGVVVADLQGRVVDLNPAARRILGRETSETVGLPVARLVPGWKHCTKPTNRRERPMTRSGSAKSRRGESTI